MRMLTNCCFECFDVGGWFFFERLTKNNYLIMQNSLINRMNP
ncbi:hypothetical protein VAE130_550133 [Vibrio aestuarianus]|nr:hypothetical protein VAE128_440132 [Vibrio aestuarianus]CAH8185681.1 hypothetical protein VAE130_550133 [Vibrio aestuarianus]CAH8191930.1 hypothetical protein VAE142_870131 [Vibrio aestuarianus]